MRPLLVCATNYGPYRSLEWSVPRGLTAILGRNDGGEGISSNGAGKTKLLEVMPIALFGPRLPWGEYLTLGAVEEKCTVELEFEHRGERYRVTRTFDPRGRGKTTLDFEQRCEENNGPDYPEPPYWINLTRESQAETQAVLNDLLGMTEATFSQSVFAAQGAQHFADPALTPAQRKQVLAEALGLDLWERLCKVATDLRRETEVELTAAQQRLTDVPDADAITEAERALARDAAAAEQMEAEIAALEQTVARLRDFASARSEHAVQRATLASARDTAKAEFQRLDDLRVEGVQARAAAETILPQINAESNLAATVPMLEEELRVADLLAESMRVKDDGLAKARSAHEQALGFDRGAAEVAAKIEQVEAEVLATCDRCGQKMGDMAKETALNSMRGDQRTLETQASALKAEADRLLASADSVQLPTLVRPREETEALLRAARESEQMLARLEARYEALGASLARVEQGTFTEAHTAARDALDAAENLLRALPAPPLPPADVDPSVNHEAMLRLRRDNLTLLVGSRGAAEERLRAMRERFDQAATDRGQVEVLGGRVDELRFMERAYGRDGIPALLLEQLAVPQIEAEAQRVLQALGTDFRVELRTQRALKTADRQRETLDVVVCDQAGERSYASFSGGERTRINLALRIGLARLIASRKGSDMRVFCADEPEFLDSEGLRRLPEVLRSLTEFDTVLLISHDEALSDQFDQTVLVVREGDESRIVA